MKQSKFSSYQSPFSWRYGSKEMRSIWSEKHKYELWRKIWVSLSTAQHKAGLVTKQELDDLKKYEKDIAIERILEIEKVSNHDVVAAIREFGEKAKIGGKKLHLGATSMDIVDNADAIRIKESLGIIAGQLSTLLKLFSRKIDMYADLPCMGYTHLQPAEPTTVGYRLAFYAQDLLTNAFMYQFMKAHLIKGKGMKGAVGTRATVSRKIDEDVMKRLGIKAWFITTQVYPRNMDFWVLSWLSSMGTTIAKFATDLRFLQSPMVGEWSEPFGNTQVGSSAMPFKRNPVNSEKICSLARYIVRLPEIMAENAMLSILERTLDDSANRRIIIPEAFLATNEILSTAIKIIDDLVINKDKIAYNLRKYASQAAMETILMESVKRGANRQEMHETLRTVRDLNDPKILKYFKQHEISAYLNVSSHIGDAPKRAKQLAREIIKII